MTTLNNLTKRGNVSLTVDAYCVIECEGTKVRTHHVSDNLNPSFNYGALFYVAKPASSRWVGFVSQNFPTPSTYTFHGTLRSRWHVVISLWIYLIYLNFRQIRAEKLKLV